MSVELGQEQWYQRQTGDFAVQSCDFGIGVVNQLVHLCVETCIFLSETFPEEFLIESEEVIRLESSFYDLSTTYISCVLWYAQKPNARPAHSIIVFGSRPLRTLVL